MLNRCAGRTLQLINDGDDQITTYGVQGDHFDTGWARKRLRARRASLRRGGFLVGVDQHDVRVHPTDERRMLTHATRARGGGQLEVEVLVEGEYTHGAVRPLQLNRPCELQRAWV